MPKEKNSKHEATLWTGFEFQFWGFNLTDCFDLSGYDLLSDGFEPHVGEEDDKDGNDDDRQDSSSGGSILGLSIVPHEFAGGKEIHGPECFASNCKEWMHFVIEIRLFD